MRGCVREGGGGRGHRQLQSWPGMSSLRPASSDMQPLGSGFGLWGKIIEHLCNVRPSHIIHCANKHETPLKCIWCKRLTLQ